MPIQGPSSEVLAIVRDLSADEARLMRVLARVPKSSSTRIFSERDLTRKKACRDIGVSVVLHGLVPKGLVVRVRRGLWQTTSLGGQVEHYLEYLWLQETLGYPSERR